MIGQIQHRPRSVQISPQHFCRQLYSSSRSATGSCPLVSANGYQNHHHLYQCEKNPPR
jgi:hypothetical protein